MHTLASINIYGEQLPLSYVHMLSILWPWQSDYGMYSLPFATIHAWTLAVLFN